MIIILPNERNEPNNVMFHSSIDWKLKSHSKIKIQVKYKAENRKNIILT